MLLRELDSFWKRTLTVAALACALALPACGDDADTNTDGSPSTEDDDADDDVTDDDSDDDVTDDDSEPTDDDTGDDDDGPTRGNLDGGTRMDGGRTDARVADGSASDSATSDAGDAGSEGDAARPAVDAGGLDATVEGDARVADARVEDASSDARVDANTPDERPDRGRGNGRDVVIIGDSWMNNTLGTGPLFQAGGVGPALIRVTGQRYRDYARQGTQLLEDNDLGPAIPTQFDAALRESRDIKTVIMTAGGNDVLLTPELRRDCAMGGQACDAILADVGEALATLWGRMAAAGVQDIVHLLYASEAGDGFAKRDENNRRLQEICDAVPAPARCHLFETDDLVGPSDFIFDGIHPNAATNERLARALATFLEEEGIRR